MIRLLISALAALLVSACSYVYLIEVDLDEDNNIKLECSDTVLFLPKPLNFYNLEIWNGDNQKVFEVGSKHSTGGTDHTQIVFEKAANPNLKHEKLFSLTLLVQDGPRQERKMFLFKPDTLYRISAYVSNGEVAWGSFVIQKDAGDHWRVLRRL